MVYPYMTLADGTEIVYTNVFEEDGIKKVCLLYTSDAAASDVYKRQGWHKKSRGSFRKTY